ncbi:MAG: hypothetical protein ACYC4S_15470 [Rhodoferax sp.]
MQNTVDRRSEPRPNPFIFSPLPDALRRDPQRAQGECADHQFIALLDAYRASGGLAPAQEVAALFKRNSACGGETLTRMIANAGVICFAWQSTLWLPLFQFKHEDSTLQAGLSEVLATLSTGLDAWLVANWFGQPNPWLGGRTPVAVLNIDPQAVLNAARALHPRV